MIERKIMRFYLIRHGATHGNREQRYVGCTDEGILEEEIDRMRKKGQSFPSMDGIFLSPYLRCKQSAYALFSIFQYQDYKRLNQKKELNHIFQTKGKIEVVEDFREMDFGIFEYKNYQELDGNTDYQKFIDSAGKTGFPEGESLQKFQFRCQESFLKCVKKAKENEWETVAFVVHGGTIMAILEAFGYPKKEYYDYQVSNGCGYILQLEEKSKEKYISLRIEEEIK